MLRCAPAPQLKQEVHAAFELEMTSNKQTIKEAVDAALHETPMKVRGAGWGWPPGCMTAATAMGLGGLPVGG